jgi:hypothetical protein
MHMTSLLCNPSEMSGVSLSIDMAMLFSCVKPSVALCVAKKCHAIVNI